MPTSHSHLKSGESSHKQVTISCLRARQYKLDAFINFIHEKFSVETFNSHGVSRAVDSGNPVVLLAIPVVNFNRLPFRTHKHILLHGCLFVFVSQ
jgi:hypothetical protein